jgi:hypothetical protein
VQLGINKYLVDTDCCPTAAVIQLLNGLRRSAKTSNEILLRNTSEASPQTDKRTDDVEIVEI